MRIIVSVLIACLCLASNGCGKKETTESKLTPVTLQLNWKAEPQFGGFYAGGYIRSYDNQGLEVIINQGGVGTPTVQMVAAGKVAFGVCSADEIVLARANGADVVGLFAVFQTNPQGLMTRADRGFNEIGDIFAQQGTVAMQRGLPYAQFLERKYGFDKINVVPSPGGDLSMLRSDPQYTMQCFVTAEPIAAKKAGIDVRTFLVADAGYNPYTTVLATRGEFARTNPKLVRGMVQAVREGWEAYFNDPTKANAAIAMLNPTMDADTLKACGDAQLSLIRNDETQAKGLGLMTLERWTALCRQLEELKVVEKAPDPASCFVDVSKM